VINVLKKKFSENFLWIARNIFFNVESWVQNKEMAFLRSNILMKTFVFQNPKMFVDDLLSTQHFGMIKKLSFFSSLARAKHLVFLIGNYRYNMSLLADIFI
jgi:hypothetical protein